jgi:DNA-binding transcriptional MerR regulator
MLTPIDRASSSHRRYSDADIAGCAFSRGCASRACRSPASALHRARARGESIAERRELLVAHRERVRAQLDEITASLRAIDHKIDIYDKEISLS